MLVFANDPYVCILNIRFGINFIFFFIFFRFNVFQHWAMSIDWTPKTFAWKIVNKRTIRWSSALIFIRIEHRTCLVIQYHKVALCLHDFYFKKMPHWLIMLQLNLCKQNLQILYNDERLWQEPVARFLSLFYSTIQHSHHLSHSTKIHIY